MKFRKLDISLVAALVLVLGIAVVFTLRSETSEQNTVGDYFNQTDFRKQTLKDAGYSVSEMTNLFLYKTECEEYYSDDSCINSCSFIDYSSVSEARGRSSESPLEVECRKFDGNLWGQETGTGSISIE